MARTRPRGFIENWSPKPETIKLVDQVKGILELYLDILPLALRQIYYMLISNHGFDKTERAYQRLSETMNRARRARLIEMSDIRDDGLTELCKSGWQSEDALLSAIVSEAENFTLDRQDSQETKLIIWCESGGMAPQLATAVKKYQIPVLSSGGFDSVTTKHMIARRIADLGDVEILHIGDHDPSGVHIYSSLDEDLTAFVEHFGGSVTVTRLAVTPEQIAELNLPTAPRKRSDNRSFAGEETTQAEAIPPRKLREIVINAIEDRLDRDAFDAILEREVVIRERLSERLGAL
jgi:hypothetical protein